MITRSWQRVRSALTGRERTSGEPQSANGASSFHLVWDLPVVPLAEVSVTLEVLVPPVAKRLYFWAMQVSFASQHRLYGGAHLGIQWNKRYPGGTAVNWGGYGPVDRGESLLSGSVSPLPGPRSDPHTREFPWAAGHPYRLRVAPSPSEAPEGLHAWRGTITDLDGDREYLVRDLYAPGEFLMSPMVWSEVFARCEHSSVTVRWSDLLAVTADGEPLSPRHVRVNYQSRSDGGCDNTTVGLDELGVLQSTAVPRRIPQGATLPVPGVTPRRGAGGAG
jgi:hypothetical protein